MTRNLVFIGLVLGALLRAFTGGAEEPPRAPAQPLAADRAAAPACAADDPFRDDAPACG